jgi:hypothetical protein
VSTPGLLVLNLVSFGSVDVMKNTEITIWTSSLAKGYDPLLSSQDAIWMIERVNDELLNEKETKVISPFLRILQNNINIAFNYVLI